MITKFIQSSALELAALAIVAYGLGFAIALML